MPYLHFVLVLLVLVLPAYCQDVLLLQTRQDKSVEIDRIKALIPVMGLRAEITYPDVLVEVMPHIRDSQMRTHAILVSASALSSLGGKLEGRLLRLSQDKHLPVLIFGIDTTTNPELIRRWSGQSLNNCVAKIDTNKTIAKIMLSKTVSNGPLGGLEIPSTTVPACELFQGKKNSLEIVATASSGSHKSILLARTGDVFFAPHLESSGELSVKSSLNINEAFSSIAPFAIFLRDTAGDYAWHIEGHYANFTIDDPWLIEPYGNLNYATLLEAMKAHRFHTTIAFIPWNYDRSQPEVVDLFRRNSKYYSICLHGNNHTHREFGDYSSNPLAQQIDDIKQAVVRMDKFQNLTGIGYDRFMVFPHGVAPEATFEQLNKYGFLGTANSLNTPLDIQTQENSLEHLRPYTNKYGGLLSILRYSAAVPPPEADLAVHAYLGNPILMYAHQEDFHEGGKFIGDEVDQINRLLPDVHWVSLGEMARHLYLQRRHSDGAGVDISMLSSEATITNNTEIPLRFYIKLPTPLSNLANVQIDGNSVPILKSDIALLQVDISGGQSRTVIVKSVGESELQDLTVSKGGIRAFMLRGISDFRDLCLSRISMGQAIIKWYYSSGVDSVEKFIEQKWKYFFGVFVIFYASIFKFGRVQSAR